MRYPVFDGLRGVFLLLMMYGHAVAVLPSRLGVIINHHQIGFADAAHGFVFLSGLVIALYFMRVLRERGEGALAPLVRRRLVTIYLYHIGALIGLALVANVLPQTSGVLGVLGRMGVGEYLAMIFLIHQPSFFDILPMYMVFIAATPLVLRLFERGHAAAVLAASIGLWLMSRTGVTTTVISAVEWKIDTSGFAIRFSMFNLLSWQLIYVAGLIFGYLTFTGRFRAGLVRAWPTSFIKTVLLVFIGLLLFQQFLTHHPARFDYAMDTFTAVHSKWNSSILFVASVVAYGIIITWLYVAGPHSPNSRVASAARYFRALLLSGPMVLLGRNSIQVFTYHLVVVYLLSLLPDLYPMGELLRYAIIIVSTLSLFAFATIWTRVQQRRRLVKASV